jgi:ribosomal protein L20
MISGKSIQWHYDASIEQWNWIAETGRYKTQAPIILKHPADYQCYMCELYRSVYCKNCPFVKKYGYFPAGVTCECAINSPYRDWKTSFGFKEAKEHAIAIAQLMIDHYPMDYDYHDSKLKWKKFKAERVQRYNSENLTNYSGYSELLHKLTLKNWSCSKIGKIFNCSKVTIKAHLVRMNVDRSPSDKTHNRKLTIAQAKLMKDAMALCVKFGVNPQTVYNMYYDKSWKDI